MKKKILSILLAISMVSGSFTVLATDDVAVEENVEATTEDAGSEALAEYNGPYEEYQIVKVDDGDKVIVDVSDTITLEMLNQNVINWTYDQDGLYIKRDDDNNPHLGVEYPKNPDTGYSSAHYWATLTSKQAGKYVVDGNAYDYTLKEYYKVMSFKIIVNDSVSLKEGQTQQLSPIMKGAITWKSNDKNIVTVDESGNITAVAGGKTTVTATDEDGDVVTFTVEVERKSDYVVIVGRKKQIPNADLTDWASLDDSIVMVDTNGEITGVALGKATVTAKDSEGNLVEFQISVKELQYFNTNIFDYKEYKPNTPKLWSALEGEGVTYLDNLDFREGSWSGYGSIGTGECGACVADRDWYGAEVNPIIGICPDKNNKNQVVGYENGITLHATDSTNTEKPQPNAFVEVNVPEGATEFTAVAGINQCVLEKDSGMTFTTTVYAEDGTEVSKIENKLGTGAAYEACSAIIDLDVTGASYLRLEVFDDGANGSDHAVWADAKFTTFDVDQSARMIPLMNNDGHKSINDIMYAKNQDTSQGIYFAYGTNESDYEINGKHNGYVGAEIVQGIAKEQIEGSRITFNYDEPGLFDMSTNEAKDSFTNVKFPFVMDEEGYYEFDSKFMDASFKDGVGQNGATLNWYDGSANYDGVDDHGDHTGFFPFNDTNGATEYHEGVNHWFGMNMGVDFYMMNDGYMDPEKKEPIVFEFSGDDDVWVFIDGMLVLDLGGIHDKASGKIDFGARTVTTTPANGTTTTASFKDLMHDPDWGLGKDATLHSLQVFYLERGKNASNLKIKFNLPQRDQLVVEKVFDNTEATDIEKAELAEKEFTYKLTKDGDIWPNAEFVVFEQGAIINRNGSTTENGEFTLKYGQKAVFTLEMPRPDPHTYQVEEIFNEPNFTTTWEYNLNNSKDEESGNYKHGKGKLAEEIEIGSKEAYNRKNVDVYTNTFHNYRETILADDTVVIDYGKKMNIDVWANDEVYTARKPELTNVTNTNGIFTANGDVITFAPSKYMDAIETTDYTVHDVHGEDKSATVTVIPATTVYYEDDFYGITYVGEWGTEGNSTTSTDIQDDGTVGAGNNYGYDSTYDGDSLYSAGGAHYIDGKGKDTTASFTFTGTGFDIISRTDNETGRIRVVAENSAGDQVYAKILDTVYLTEGEELYQIPVIRKTELPYDTYTVTITVLGDNPSTEEKDNTRFYLDAVRVYNPLGTGEDLDDRAEDAYSTDKELNPFIQEIRNLLIDQTTLDPTKVIGGFVYVDSEDNVSKVGTYEQKGPNNEVYLKQDNGVYTTLKTESGNAPNSIQLGLKAPNCKEKGAVEVRLSIIPTDVDLWYNEDEGVIDKSKWIESKVVRLESATDMYIDLKDYFVDEEGESTVDWENLDWSEGVTIGIANPRPEVGAIDKPNSDAIVSLTTLKTTGEDVYFDLHPELLTAMLCALNYEELDTLTINSAVVDKHSAKAEITVNTTEDITKLIFMEDGKAVKTKKVTQKVEEDGTITWKATLNLSGKAKSHVIDIYAVDAEGNKSEAAHVTVNVKKGGK